MIRRPRLHSIATSNSGLTLIPVLASILLLSIFMGLLVQRQVRGQLAWKMEVRKSIARNMGALGARPAHAIESLGPENPFRQSRNQTKPEFFFG